MADYTPSAGAAVALADYADKLARVPVAVGGPFPTLQSSPATITGQGYPTAALFDVMIGGLLPLPPATWAVVVTAASVALAVAGVHYDVDASGGVRTVTLPAAAVGNKGQQVTVAKSDASANAVTVNTTAGTINGAASKDIGTRYGCFTFRSLGTEWRVV